MPQLYPRKCLPLAECDVKLADSGAMEFEGYASTFNRVDAYGDTVLPGAFADTLKNRTRPIMMRWNHGEHVIGKYTAVAEDDHGLRVRGELTKGHRVAEDVYASLRHGAVSGLSIGYRIPSGGSQRAGKVRQLKRIDLIEVSVVDTPADLYATVVDVKAAIDELASLSDVEALLREAAGLSRSDATALVSRIKSIALGERDAGTEAAEIAALIRAVRIPGA